MQYYSFQIAEQSWSSMYQWISSVSINRGHANESDRILGTRVKELGAWLIVNTNGIWVEWYKEITWFTCILLHTNTRTKTTGFLDVVGCSYFLSPKKAFFWVTNYRVYVTHYCQGAEYKDILDFILPFNNCNDLQFDIIILSFWKYLL